MYGEFQVNFRCSLWMWEEQPCRNEWSIWCRINPWKLSAFDEVSICYIILERFWCNVYIKLIHYIYTKNFSHLLLLEGACWMLSIANRIFLSSFFVDEETITGQRQSTLKRSELKQSHLLVHQIFSLYNFNVAHT